MVNFFIFVLCFGPKFVFSVTVPCHSAVLQCNELETFYIESLRATYF